MINLAPLEMIAIGKKLSNIYQNLSAPVCQAELLPEEMKITAVAAIAQCLGS